MGNGRAECLIHSKSKSLPKNIKICLDGDNGAGEIRDLQQIWEQNMTINEGANSPVRCENCTILEENLVKAESKIIEKDAEIEKLREYKHGIGTDVLELTATLFEQANKQVNDATLGKIAAVKSRNEAKMQVEGLLAENVSLKKLVVTPRPDLDSNSGGNSGTSGRKTGIPLFKKKKKEKKLKTNPTENGTVATESVQNKPSNDVVIDRSKYCVDPVLLSQLAAWISEPTFNRKKSHFLNKIYLEEIDPILTFANESLTSKLRKAIENDSIFVEPIVEKVGMSTPKECELVFSQQVCCYHMRFGFESDECFDISKFCRNRIVAVCEFFKYLRYIQKGLVKVSLEDSYWEILRLRKQMSLAKLGISIS